MMQINKAIWNRAKKVQPAAVAIPMNGDANNKPVDKMANVRRSSVFLAEFDRRKGLVAPTEREGSDKVDAQVAVIEIEAALEEQQVDMANTIKNSVPRRHSTGNASTVNSANLRASIRRLQRRRFRTSDSCAAVKCLEYFLAFLYYIGMSPLKPASAKHLPKWCLGLQLGIYWILALISVLEAIARVKTGWIDFLVEENMLTFVSFGYFVANFLTRIYYIKMFATSSEATATLLKKISVVNCQTVHEANYAYLVAVMIGVLSLALAMVSAVVGEADLKDWSLEEAMSIRSFELSMSLFIWSSDNLKSTTVYLYTEYGKGLTGINKLLAIAGNVLNFCGTLHACVLLDIWPIIAIQIYMIQSQLSKIVEKTDTKGFEDRCPISVHWQYYLRIRKVCDGCDEVFGKLLKLLHMQNMLLFGYFLLEILKKEPLSAPLLIDTVTVMKVSMTYFLAQRTAAKNEQYEACVINCSKRLPTVEMNGLEVSVPMLLADMKKHPIGVGRGEFFVDEGFVLKFAGTVGSIFVLLSGETGETCKKNNV